MPRPADLENRVLDTLWSGGEWSVREVRQRVDPELAHTTFATVLDRLHGKGEVDRRKVDGSWRYAAARSRSEALAAEVGQVLKRAEGATEPLLIAFLDQLSEAGPDTLDRLEALLRARKEQQ